MLEAWVMALILSIAPKYDIPPMLVAAIIIVESEGNPEAVGRNYDENGELVSLDLGLMQLNSSWFTGDWRNPETNITAGCRHLRFLYDQTKHISPYWWSAVVAYNCGLSRLKSEKVPSQSLNYASKIFMLWVELDPHRAWQVGMK